MIAPMAAVLLLIPIQQEKVTLQWKFSKGQVLRYEAKTTSESPGVSQSFTMGYLMEVTEVGADGSARMKVSYNRIAIKISGLQELDFDSARDKKAPDHVLAQIMAGFVGPSYEMKMAKTGAILEVRGMSEFMKKVEASVDEKHRRVVALVAKQYTDQAAKDTMSQGFAAFPDRPLAKGDTWSTSAKFPLMGMGKADYRFDHRLVGVRNGEAVVSQKTAIVGGQIRNVEIKGGSGNTEIRFLIDRGMLKSSKGTTEIKMVAGGQEVTSKTTVEIVLVP